MINVKIDKKKESITHSTLIKVENRYISLSVTKHLGYAKPYQIDLSLPIPKGIDLFEDVFYWKKETFIEPKLNHLSYTRMKDSSFLFQSGLVYELQWEEIKVTPILDSKNNLHSITLANKDKIHLIAVPSESFKDERYDYITNDGFYHYDCKKDEYEGIEVIVKKFIK